jgi:hypothetical protein
MARRFLSAALVLAALCCDAGGSHGLALALMLSAVPAAFVLALDCYGDALESRCSLARPILAALSLVLLVLSAALRSPAVHGGVPPLAVSAPIVALILYALVAVGGLLLSGRTVSESA